MIKSILKLNWLIFEYYLLWLRLIIFENMEIKEIYWEAKRRRKPSNKQKAVSYLEKLYKK